MQNLIRRKFLIFWILKWGIRQKIQQWYYFYSQNNCISLYISNYVIVINLPKITFSWRWRLYNPPHMSGQMIGKVNSHETLGHCHWMKCRGPFTITKLWSKQEELQSLCYKKLQENK